MNDDDIDAVLAIDLITWPTESWPGHAFSRALTDPTWYCWVAEDSSSDPFILGYGLQHSADQVSHIANLCVHPYRRGCGVGGILLRHMVNQARRKNLAAVTLEVNASNDHAYKLYENHGFRITDVLPKYYRDGSDAYKMHLSTIIDDSYTRCFGEMKI